MNTYYCIGDFFLSVIKHSYKAFWRGKGLTQLTLPGNSQQMTDVRLVTQVENMDESCLLACSLASFFYSPGSCAKEWCHPKWAGSSYINNPQNYLS